MTNLIGQSLGRYHIIEQLGEGGMATVYKAFDTRLERPVALKVILPMREHTENFLKRFEREAKGLAKLSHPNIVKVLDYGEYEGMPFLVMEYQPGGTLKDKLGKPMGWREAARLLAPVARALAYAHGQKVVHRDVKPSNILLTGSGEPMLSDFGVAKMLVQDKGVELTGTGVGIGTPEYMAPEQGMGKEVDGRTDIYSLGIVFYELVTGRKPYRADTPMAVLYKQMTEALPHPRQYVGELPEGVVGVMMKALAKEPENRYQDGEAFAEALERLGRGEVEGVWGETVKEAPKSRRLGWLIGGLIGLVVLALGIGLGFFLMRSGSKTAPVAMATGTSAPTKINAVTLPTATQEIPTLTPTELNLVSTNTSAPAAGQTILPTPTGKLAWSDDFEDGFSHGITFNSGNWQVVDDGSGNKVLQCNGDCDSYIDSTDASPFSDGVIEFRFKSIGGNMAVDLRLYGSNYTDYGIFYDSQAGNITMHYQDPNGWAPMEGTSGTGLSQPIMSGWTTLRVDAQGKYFKVYINGDLTINAYDSRDSAGRIEFGGNEIQFDDIQVWENNSQ